jgi:hypothetical protein
MEAWDDGHTVERAIEDCVDLSPWPGFLACAEIVDYYYYDKMGFDRQYTTDRKRELCPF